MPHLLKLLQGQGGREAGAWQYYFARPNYNEAIKCLAAIPKYRIQAKEIAKSD